MAINVAEVKKRLSALLNDDSLVDEYLRRFGPQMDIKNIKALKQEKEKNMRTGEEGKGDDPIFETYANCRVCHKKDIVYYQLKAKTQKILQTIFLVPKYESIGDYKTVDYKFLNVAVCPRCLCASADKRDFVREDNLTGKQLKSNLGTNVVLTLQQEIGNRKTMLKQVHNINEYFQRPRTSEAAIMSYLLSNARAEVEALHNQPYAYYKIGFSLLKIAQIKKDGGQNNEEELQQALKQYEEAFTRSNCPSEEIEMQVIYTIVALYLRFGNQKKAHAYLSVFDNILNDRKAEMKEKQGLTTATIDKWRDRARRVWEDRDEPSLFEGV